jgi:endonuclease/exonuclease/phosphatase family metal-dependent hydrolase
MQYATPTAGRILLPDGADASANPLRLRLLSYNIQVGLRTRDYLHYLRGAWRHAWPSGQRANLDRIAAFLGEFDFVAIQEADAGSFRTKFLNQVEYLARLAGFPHAGLAVTRDLHPVARHSLGYLSRIRPAAVTEHALPSLIPGRRAMSIDLGETAGGLRLVVTHLSLGRRTQHRQLHYLSALARDARHAVLLGDLNCEPEFLRQHSGLRDSGLWLPPENPVTFPSWKPRRSIDHILVSPELKVERLESLPHAHSDHLPLAADIIVPRS